MANEVETARKKQKTYNSEDSPVVTHLATSSPEYRLTQEELTGFCLVGYPMAVCGSFGVSSFMRRVYVEGSLITADI